MSGAVWGMSEQRSDPRLTPARADLAAESLRGIVDAPRYVVGEARRVVVPVAPLRREPYAGASLDTEALYGEAVTVFEDDAEGWSWVQLASDGYVGYMPTAALWTSGPDPTHRVKVSRTFLFPGPDIKLPPMDGLCFASRVAVRRVEGRFAFTERGAIFAAHLEPLGTVETDFVEVATRFLGVPYLWGGRSALGLDCSGLVQTALNACGLPCPRDSHQQEAALGVSRPLEGPFQRGDLLFWPGHVAIVEAPDVLLHANAHHMMVAREPLGPALQRIADAGLPLRTAKRLALSA